MKNAAKKAVCFSLLFCFITVAALANKIYDFNATCQQAYKEITSLRLTNGEKLVTQARQQNPDNLIPDLLDSYIDFFILFFNEDPAELKIREPHFDEYLDRINGGSDASPFYNYSRAVVLIQKACVEIKFGERWSAGWNFRKAFTLIRDNKKRFPNFLPNNMLYGPMLVVASTVPDSYKWLAGLFGIKGSISNGMALMQTVLSSNDGYARLFLMKLLSIIVTFCFIFKISLPKLFNTSIKINLTL